MNRYVLMNEDGYSDPIPCPLIWEGIENFNTIPDDKKASYGWYPFVIDFDVPIYDVSKEYISGTEMIFDEKNKQVVLRMQVKPYNQDTLTFLSETRIEALDILEEVIEALERRGMLSTKELSKRSQSILVSRRKVKNGIPRNIEVVKIKEI
jgi:hypothetical protein